MFTERIRSELSKALVSLCVMTASAIPSLSDKQTPRSHSAHENRNEQMWRGEYVNSVYGYSMIIPKGFVAIGPPAPWPQHGVDIQLTRTSDAHIFTNGDFSASDYQSLEAVVTSDLEDAKNSRTSLIVANRGARRLGPLRAIETVFKYKDNSSTETIVEQRITAIRPRRESEESILYTLRLRTTEVRYSHDRQVFSHILKSWRMRPLPK